MNATSRFELMGLDKNRAQLNYMLNCQGCHAGDGRGLGDVPALKGFVGNFLSSNEGRAYLIRVPGSANSPLTDVELAEVVNWILFTMSDKSLANSFNPLSPEGSNLSRATNLRCESREIHADRKIPNPVEASAVTGLLHHNTGVRQSGKSFHRSPET